MLTAASHSVKYEAANILMVLTSNPAAVKGKSFDMHMTCSLLMNIDLAAATCYIDLAVKESDNNVKLIVLDRLDNLLSKQERKLDDLVMDILRILSR